MSRTNFFKAILTLVVGISLSYCGSSSSSFSSNNSSPPDDTDTAVGGNVNEINVTNGNSQVTFTDLSNDDEVVILLFSFNESSTSTAFQIGTSENAVYLSDDFLMDDALQEEDLTGELHSLLRLNESYLDPEAALEGGEAVSNYVTKQATLGSQRTFKVLNSFSSTSSFATVTATLRYENIHFQFYVDARNSDSLTDSDLQELAEDFARILAAERRLFGEESDVNGDDKFVVLFTQTVNELGGNAGGMVTGFFYAIDLFDVTQYAISNEMEIFYSFVPDPNGNYGTSVTKSFAMNNIYPGVLAHEIQHLISFNTHFFINGGSAETGWLNEGMSHLAEDIYSVDSNDYMVSTGIENPARIASFLSNISSVCYTCGTNLSQRGGSYLFVRYLYEQAEIGNLDGATNGADFIDKLLDTSLRGVDNIVNAANGTGSTEQDFISLMGLYGLAVYLSNSGTTEDDRFMFNGINLRSIQDDNRGTILNGPVIQDIVSFPFVDTLTGNSMIYMQLSGESINAVGGTLNFSFGTTADFGGYVIRD